MNNIKKNYRIMPITIKKEESNKVDISMTEIELIKEKPFSYLVYGYLQQISNSDKDTMKDYRKVYIDNFSGNKISSVVKMSKPTVLNSLKFLQEKSFLSKETFEDSYGKYKKLYVLNCKHYVKLDFSDRRIEKLNKCIKETGLRLYLIYKYYCDLYGECYLSMEQLCKLLNLSYSGKNKKTISLYNEVLSDIGLIKVEKKSRGKYKNKNTYKCL